MFFFARYRILKKIALNKGLFYKEQVFQLGNAIYLKNIIANIRKNVNFNTNTVIFCYKPLSTALIPVWILIFSHSDSDSQDGEGGGTLQQAPLRNAI